MIDTESYRRVSDDFPQAVAFLATRVGRWDLVTVVDSFLDISYDPPTMAVSLYSASRAAEAVDEHGSCALTIVAEDQIALVDRFAQPGLPLQGMLAGVDHTRDDRGNALIAGGVTYFELERDTTVPAATHDLVICRVVGAFRGPGNVPAVRFARRFRPLGA